MEESLSKEDVALEEWKSNTEWDLPEQPLHDSIEAEIVLWSVGEDQDECC